MQIVLMTMLWLLPFSQSLAGPRRSDPVLVRSVIDGDTINIQSMGRVSLLGIEAPVLGHGTTTSAPFAAEARARLAALVLNRWVRLERDTTHVGATRRPVAYVLTDDGQFINAVMVREGLARVSARTPLARLDQLQYAEREAQQSRRGIWGGTPQIPAAGYTPPPIRVPKRSR